MKIQLASDLHLEFLERRFPRERIIEPAPGADLLVLAGDIHHGTKAFALFNDWPVPVILLAGNHEFYGRSWEQTRVDLREACSGTNVMFLDNDAVELGGVRFLGCTMWTDFRERGFTQSQSMSAVEEALNDYQVIHTQEGTLRARDTLADHEQSRRWMERELAKPFAGKTVVVTHHGPHPLSTHPHGFEALNEVARSLQVVRTFHGHHHDDLSHEYAKVRGELGFDARAVNYCGIKNGLGEIIVSGPKGW